MRKLVPTLLLACTFSTVALADSVEPQLSSDSRIRLLRYTANDVYTITTKYGYQTNVVFAPGEDIETISVGDRSMWQIIPTGNRMFIRPMGDNIITNMTVLTNKRSYQFDLKSLNGEKGGGNIYVAQFVYDEDSHKNDAPASAPQAALPPTALPPTTPPPVDTAPSIPANVPTTMPVSSAPASSGVTQPILPNYNYTYAGPDNLAPLQVYDNGRSTFIKVRDTAQQPGAFMVDSGGKEIPVSYNVMGDRLVVDMIVPELALHYPAGAVHIYNEMLNPK